MNSFYSDLHLVDLLHGGVAMVPKEGAEGAGRAGGSGAEQQLPEGPPSPEPAEMLYLI